MNRVMLWNIRAMKSLIAESHRVRLRAYHSDHTLDIKRQILSVITPVAVFLHFHQLLNLIWRFALG
jgi:hypothetical protein